MGSLIGLAETPQEKCLRAYVLSPKTTSKSGSKATDKHHIWVLEGKQSIKT